MLLNIDIGNTTTDLAICGNQSVKEVITLDNLVKSAEYSGRFKTGLRRLAGKYRIDAALICSVVPAFETKCYRYVSGELNIKPLCIGTDINVPIINLYKNKKQVGQDRLVCAYAVKELYGTPAIIIDLGTAITFDVVTPKGQYDGGMIVPGIKMSTDSLYAKTALLPQVKSIHIPKQLIGKTTEESILSGIFYGYGSMCSGLIDQLSRKFKAKPKVIVTGGYTDYMQKFIKTRITKREPQLIFKGMSLIYKNLG